MKGFAAVGLCSIRWRITVVLLGVSWLPQSAKVIEIKMLVHVVLGFTNLPCVLLSLGWGGTNMNLPED